MLARELISKAYPPRERGETLAPDGLEDFRQALERITHTTSNGASL